MLIGYARVSTHDQTLNLQKDALEKAGCSKIFTDTISGATLERPGLEKALSFIRPGDTLVVWRLDRLGQSLRHLIETITSLHNKQIGFKSLTENIDTTTSGGKLIFHIFGALAEFERNLIRERTTADSQLPELEAGKAADPKPSRHNNAALRNFSMMIQKPLLRRCATPSRSPKPRCTALSKLEKDTSHVWWGTKKLFYPQIPALI